MQCNLIYKLSTFTTRDIILLDSHPINFLISMRVNQVILKVRSVFNKPFPTRRYSDKKRFKRTSNFF